MSAEFFFYIYKRKNLLFGKKFKNIFLDQNSELELKKQKWKINHVKNDVAFPVNHVFYYCLEFVTQNPENQREIKERTFALRSQISNSQNRNRTPK